MTSITLIAVAKSTPAWAKTTLVSWLGTASGLGIAEYKEDIQVIAIIVGGILVPIAGFSYQVFRDRERGKKK
tara:strand:- start:516 stop:731 length:216 start_codon:yes stop_codon:yes gene_type:complete